MPNEPPGRLPGVAAPSDPTRPPDPSAEGFGPQAQASGVRAAGPLRSIASTLLKVVLTGGAFYLLLTHKVRTESGETVMALRAILDYLPKIDAATFWRFTLLAFVIKAIGIFASMVRWHVLLRAQGVVFPLGHIFTTFMIGRFLGTFLPSTIGLDGYKLYDAARFSGRTVEATAATIVEKGLAIIGIFATFLVTLPFGASILGAHAGTIVAITIPTALAVIGGFFLVAFNPAVVAFVLDRLPVSRQGRLASVLERVNAAAAAYRTHKPLLLYAAALSFVVHFCTAAMYYFTALAIGARQAGFWEVTCASTIQVFATVISPFTIAGEGVREIVQTLLLAHRIGTSQSIISAALGFWATEAPTLSGAIFYFMRTADYRPRVVVAGVEVER
jgi:glycosyltransferase 2 family protein